MICFHILKVKAETGATERRREAVTKTSEEDHDREKVKNRKKVIVYEAYPKNGKKIFDDSRKVDLEVRAQWEGGKPDAEAADLVVCGYAVSKNVGIWRVDVEIYCHVGSRDRTCPLCTALGFHGVAVRRWRDEENKNENHVSAA